MRRKGASESIGGGAGSGFGLEFLDDTEEFGDVFLEVRRRLRAKVRSEIPAKVFLIHFLRICPLDQSQSFDFLTFIGLGRGERDSNGSPGSGWQIHLFQERVCRPAGVESGGDGMDEGMNGREEGEEEGRRSVFGG